MRNKRNIIIVLLMVMVFGSWYCLNFDSIISPIADTDKILYSENKNINNTIDKSEILEQNIIKININNADIDELQSLPGIGDAIAQRIVDYRAVNKGFKSIEEIQNIKGIGDKLYDKIKNYLTI